MYDDQTVAARVDARGLQCPMPLLKMKLALNTLAVGQRLALLATDPGSMRDIAAFAKIAGHRLLQAEAVGQEFHYLLEKCAEPGAGGE